MGKLKRATCNKCQRVINRHDANRVLVQVGEGANRRGVYRLEHSQCSEAGKE